MIGLFNECFPPVMDGVSVTVSNLASHFNLLGADVSVVVPEMLGLDVSRYPYPVLQYRSVPVPFRHPYRYGLPMFDFAFQRQLEQVHFDVLHAHSPFSSGSLALRMARQRGVPLVATFHSKFRDDFLRVIPSTAVVDYLVGRVVRFYECADEVWVPQATVGEVLREYGYRGHYEVVDNGSEFAQTPYDRDVQVTARRELHLDEHVPLLLFVGQHIWEKNVRLILESLARLADVPYHMLFVGDGYARDDMEALAHSLGLMGDAQGCGYKVSFWGSVRSRDVMRRVYAAADLFLFPSLYDNAPLVVREAAALHTPSLVARGSNTAEVIRDGYNGFLADNNVESYACCLRHLLGHPALLERVGRMASGSLARSWNDIAGEVLDRYRELMGRSQRRVAI